MPLPSSLVAGRIEHMFEDAGMVDADGLFPELAAAIAAVAAPARGGSAVQLGEALVAIVELERRLAATKLAMVDAFHEQGFAATWGCDSSASFLRAHTRIDPRQARQVVNAAAAARRMPAVGALAADGVIGLEHLQVIAAATRDLPDEQVAAVQATLAEAAAWARPVELHRLGKAIRETFRAEQAAKGADEARALRELHLVQTFEGMWSLTGTLPAEDGAALKVLLDATSTKAGEEDARTPTQRRADGLAAIVGLANRSGQAPSIGGDRPRLTLVVRAGQHSGGSARPALDRLSDNPRRATHTALVGELTGHQLDLPDTVVQRIACDADLDVLTLDADGEVLRLGRAVRDANVPQRRALVVRDGGCVFPYRDRPPWQCHPHHLRWWSRGAGTDIETLALLCPFHHHLVHGDGWTIDRIPPDRRPPGHTGIGWQATSPHGRTLREFRQPAA
jgi:hypothetical protein